MNADRSPGAAQPTQRRLRCVVVGEGTLPLSCADVLLDRGHTVVALIAPAAEAGAWASERQVRLLAPESDLATALNGIQHDYLFSVVNHAVLRAPVLGQPARGAINYHDAPLPRYAGVHATSWAILAGEQAHGVTWHEIAERVDAGRILVQRSVAIADDDTALSLDTKCYEAAVASFRELTAGLETDAILPQEQDLSARSYFGRRRRPLGSGALSWARSAAELDGLSRALDFGARENSMAFPALHVGGRAYACGSVRRQADRTDATPGTICGVADGALLIATRDGLVAASRLSSMAGEPVEAGALLERHGLRVGARLPVLEEVVVERVRDLYESASRHESYWTGALADPRPPALPTLRGVRAPAGGGERRVVTVRRPATADAFAVVAAAAAYLLRVNDGEPVDVDVVLRSVRARAAGQDAVFRSALPWHLDARDEEALADVVPRVAAQFSELETRGPIPRDLFLRMPALRTTDARCWANALPVAIAVRDTPTDGSDEAAVTFVVGDGCDQAWLVYDPLAIEDAAARRIAEGWATVANDGAARPNAAIGELEVLTRGERALLAAWNATDEAVSCERLHDSFAAQVRRTPTAPAVSIAGLTLTYAELDARSTQLAWALRERGVGPDVLVGICLERSLEMMVALLGTLKAGGAYLPLDPDHPSERLAFVVADASPRVVLTTAALRDRLPVSDASILALDEVTDALSRYPADAIPASDVADDDLAYVIYTSGSTGTPKGVMVPHEAAGHYVRFMRDAYPIGEHDAVLQKAPIGFDASVLELFVPLTAGARLVLATPAGHHDLRYILRLIREERVTVVQFVPSVLAAVAELPEFRESCAGVRLLFCGGEALPMELALRVKQQLRGATIHNLYGPTEVTVYATTWTVADAPTEGLAPIGRPIRNTRAYVVDSRRRPVPIGVSGELCLAGVQVARGYLARAELTTDRFLAEPGVDPARPHARMYRTGDLARWRDDGTLEYRGRADHQVKVRGFRVELGEIEQALGAHAAVRECAVICRGEGASARIVAYVVANGAPADAAALRSHLAARLPEYMVPSAFVALEQLPLSRNGKLDRRALPDPVALDDAGTYVAPVTSAEHAVTEAWTSVLRVPRVGVEDDVFALGANSLLAMRVLARLERRFGVSLPLRLVFDAPTARGMARAVDDAVARGGGVEAGPRAEGRTDAPLSYGQELLWLLERAHPGVAAYNVPELFELRGAVDVHALRAAVDDVVARHASLRTAFADRGGSAVQIVADHATPTWTIEDLRGESTDRGDTREQQIVDDLVRRPFELSSAPLLRAALLRRANDVWTLLLVHHHLVTDGWSRAVLLRDLGAAYATRCSATKPSAPAAAPAGPTYADFAAWQRARGESGALEQQLAYWRDQLRGATPVLELPVDRPRTTTRRFDAGVSTTTWPRELTERLRELGAAHGATLFMTLLAAYQALLARYSGQEDFVVGTPVAGRPREVADDAVGYYATMLPLRADLSGHPTFDELLARVRRTCLGALEHGEVPFELLLRELATPPVANRTPLFQVMFSLQNTDRADLVLDGASVNRRDRTAGWATYDQWLTVTEEGDGLRLSLEYRADLFDGDSMDALLQHLRILLTTAVDAPARAVSQLPMLTEGERQRVLRDWNQTDVDLGAPACVHALVAAQAARTPAQVAVEDDRGALTYGELETRANQLAHHLVSLGVGRGALVGLAVERASTLMVALLGIMKTGAAYVPLDASYPRERVAFMLRDSAARVLVTDESQRAGLPAFDGAIVSLDGDAGRLAHQRAVAPIADVTPDDLAYVIYTSGSTGTPKGAMLPHRAVANYLRWMHRAYTVGERDCVLQKAPVSFDASVWELYLPLICGGRVFFARPDGHRDPSYLLDTIATRGVTILQSVPSLLGVLLATPGFATSCAGIRLLVLGGEELPGRLAAHARAQMPLAEIQNLYGPTEAAVYATAWSVPSDFDGGVVPIGRPIANDRAYVLTVAGTEPMPIGVAGELCLGGAGVGDGYLNRADRTAVAFVDDPFATGLASDDASEARMYRTGDLARWRRDGVLEYLGRIDHQVKIRGFRVELGEIEAAVRRSAGVHDCAVALRSVGNRDPRLVAYVVPAQGSTIDVDTLRAALGGALPEHMVPSAFVALDALPLNSNGKLDRRALPAPPEDTSARPYVAPRTGLEQAVASAWAEIFGLERISADDDFFALGGHSLLGMRILARLSSTIGRPLPLRLLFETRTVAALASALAQEMAPPSEGEETDELLRVLEQLSDEEALRLLQSNDGNLLAT